MEVELQWLVMNGYGCTYQGEKEVLLADYQA